MLDEERLEHVRSHILMTHRNTGDLQMRWKRWVSFAILSLAVPLAARPAAAQLAPTGGHYANQPSDTGFTGGVDSSGGYSASVPLDIPGARNGLPVPVSIVYGGGGVGAAG
ncbi:MAG: hypothetical protein ACREBE_15080, partial [bacterium]